VAITTAAELRDADCGPAREPPFCADVGSMPIKLLAAQIRSSGSAASH
jgi:hypothetical protein